MNLFAKNKTPGGEAGTVNQQKSGAQVGALSDAEFADKRAERQEQPSLRRLEKLEVQFHSLTRSITDLQDKLARAPSNPVQLRSLVSDLVKEQIRRERYEPGTHMVQEASIRTEERDKYLVPAETLAAHEESRGRPVREADEAQAERDKQALDRSLERKQTVGVDIHSADVDWKLKEIQSAKRSPTPEKKKGAMQRLFGGKDKAKVQQTGTPTTTTAAIDKSSPEAVVKGTTLVRAVNTPDGARGSPGAKSDFDPESYGALWEAIRCMHYYITQIGTPDNIPPDIDWKLFEMQPALGEKGSPQRKGKVANPMIKDIDSFRSGAILACKVDAEDAANVYKNVSSSEVIGSVGLGDNVTVAGSPQEYQGRLLVPIKPAGAVELKFFQVDMIPEFSARRGALARSPPNQGFTPGALSAITVSSPRHEVRRQRYLTHHTTSDSPPANINSEPDSYEALWEAIRQRNSGEAQRILGNRFFRDINIKDSKSRTILIFAAQNGLPDICDTVLSNPRFVELDCKDAMGRTALHCAAAVGLADTCADLLDYTAFTEVNSRDSDGWTALHHAASSGSVDACRELLESRRFTAFDATDSKGCNALHVAAECGRAEVCSLLLRHHRFAKKESKSEKGYTALHWAAQSCRKEACESILDCEWFTQSDATDWNGWTALHVAGESGGKDASNILLNHRSSCVKANAKDWQGRTALHVAAECGNLGVCAEILLAEQFSEADAKDRDGLTALHYAAQKGHADVCKLLVDSPHFTAEEEPNRNGFTAIDVADGKAKQYLIRELITRKRISPDGPGDKQPPPLQKKGPTPFTSPQFIRR